MGAALPGHSLDSLNELLEGQGVRSGHRRDWAPRRFDSDFAIRVGRVPWMESNEQQVGSDDRRRQIRARVADVPDIDMAPTELDQARRPQ